MPSFGSFTTDREVYSGSAYTVYGAKKDGDSQTEYAVKVFSLHQLGLDSEPAAQLETLLSDLESSCVARIRIQQQAAAASKHVTPIVEHGRDERGVWYVTRFFSRSVNKIISGRVALSRDALEHVLRSMTTGALDMQRACGRSHGEILPSNVQISRSEKMADAEVVLSDPLPGDASESARYELADLRAIGRILLQLVLRREIDEDDTAALILPILPSPEWTKLFEKDANRWLALCNRLLDPKLSLVQITLAQLLSELDQLRYTPPVTHRTVIAGAAVLAIVIVALILVMLHFKQGRLLVLTDPPGADIKLEIDRQYRSFGKTPADKTPLRIKAPKGSYNLRAEFPGLPEQVGAVTIEGGKSRQYEFAFPYGQVRITTTPAGATVERDGQVVGTTPYTSPFLDGGPKSYVLSLADHQPEKVAVTITTNRQIVPVERRLTPMRRDDGVVEVSSIPSGAVVREGNTVLGETPIPIPLAAGTHRLTAQYQDWPPLMQEIMVAAGQKTNLQFKLPHGIARFNITPPDALVFLDDKLLGSNLTQRALQPRDYRMRVMRSGYKTNEQNITIIDGQTRPIPATLEAMLGFVEITTDPPGATIFEASAPDRELGSTQPGQPFRRSLQQGTYSFIARIDGLDPVASKPVQIAMGANVPIVLSFKYGTVQFRSDPEGADVLIAGKKVGTTPYDLRQKPGPVSYRIELADYYLEDGTKELATGAPAPVSFKLRPKEVSVVLRSDPVGAQFFLGESLLRGTNETYVMPWGDYTLTARLPVPAGLPGPDAKTEVVQVERRRTTSKKFELSYATLVLTNAEPDARLVYQNQPVASFPARLYLKPDTDYNFVVDYGGGEIRSNLAIRLAASQSYTPAIVFPDLRRLYTNSLGIVLVRVNKNLYVGRFETTEEEYQRVMGRAIESTPRGPVVNVKWDDALAFCQKLTESDVAALEKGKLKGWTYALPTDLEWARFAENDPGPLRGAVFGRLEGPLEIDASRSSSNRASLFDLFGNVAEWCLGTNNLPMTIGGAHNSRRPSQFPSDLMRITDPVRLGTSITEGSRSIGFRCVLRAP